MEDDSLLCKLNLYIYTHNVFKKVDVLEISIYLLVFCLFPLKKKKQVYIIACNVNPYENKCIDIYNVLLIFVRKKVSVIYLFTQNTVNKNSSSNLQILQASHSWHYRKSQKKKLTQTDSIGKYTITSEKFLTVLQNSKPC